MLADRFNCNFIAKPGRSSIFLVEGNRPLKLDLTKTIGDFPRGAGGPIHCY